MSSKDLCLINEIPDICKLGVESLKIEGRLKTEYYLATVVSAYRAAIDDYMKNPENYNADKYLKELEKTKTRGLTTFYFNDRDNKDFQDYSGKQYNPDWEFGGKVVEELKDGRSVIEIRNKLSLYDDMEVLIPGILQPISFTIDAMWDADTDEHISTVNPGKQDQKVILKLPCKVKAGYVLRRRKMPHIGEEK